MCLSWHYVNDALYAGSTVCKQECYAYLCSCTFHLLHVYACVLVSLTPSTAGVGIHKGQSHSLILLQGALVCKATLHWAHHMTLLLSVCNGSLIHVHRLPTDNRNRKKGNKQQKEGREYCYATEMLSEQCLLTQWKWWCAIEEKPLTDSKSKSSSPFWRGEERGETET